MVTTVAHLSPRTVAPMNPLRPPGEQGRRADELAAALERDAPLRLGILQLLDAGEVLVDQHCVRQWPQVLRRLQLWGMRWQKEQVDVLGYPHSRTVMPAGPVKHQHDLFGRTGADLLGERLQFHREEFDIDRRCQMPYRAS